MCSELDSHKKATINCLGPVGKYVFRTGQSQESYHHLSRARRQVCVQNSTVTRKLPSIV
ncbi:hypothetical protein DPMN_116525 [Dreissena polymorpha]|uniref:Uncharacterized protein n=1 Tax=Dreissena polymorpha TaxID=45954 RepID=A0A9D4KNZ2_DREPO|nr:hypothetical protein DPMN_116525 [Dreissena polymorpha]